MVQCIEEHSVDLELLPEKANILDAGCRGFTFTNFFREKGHEVFAMDIDYLEGDYKRIGLASILGKAYISNHKDPQARKLVSLKGFTKDFAILANNEVYTLTIDQIEKNFGKKFDLIKLDIEGAEFDILDQSLHPLAKQVSVEFHAHCGEQTKESLDALLDKLSEFYTIHNRIWESKHGAGFNYWDILLISK